MVPHIQQVTSLLVAQAQDSGGRGFGGADLVLPVVMMAILYFVWIRPAGKERRNHQAMLESIKRGDEIVTSSGILGTVADIQEKVMTIEIAKNVKIRVLRSAISKRVVESDKDGASDGADASSKKS